MRDLVEDFKENAIFRINESRRMIDKCAGKLTDVQWAYKQNDVTNSIANLLLHLQGNITQYIISSLGNIKDDRIRDIEFEPVSVSNVKDSVQAFHQVLDKAIAVIREASEKKLTDKRIVQGFEFSGQGCVLHAVEHLSYHTGQIALITKLLLNEETGFYEGVDLNAKNE